MNVRVAMVLLAVSVSCWSQAKPELFAPNVISTGDFDSHLEISPDGKTLYFLRSAAHFAFWTIYESHNVNGNWTRPHIAPFSGQYNDADVCITDDGKRLFFMSNRPLHKGKPAKEDTDIWYMDLQTNGTWGEAQHINGPVNSNGNEFYPRVAEDGTLYFGSDRPSGVGGVDLWRAKRESNGSYGEPENLGPNVNSPGDEYEAYTAPDQSFLIIASVRPGGMGQADFYVTYRHGDGWTPAQNLGSPVNSNGKEYGGKISRDGKLFYFSSTRTTIWGSFPKRLSTTEYEQLLHSAGNGLGDIYSIEVAALKLRPEALAAVQRHK